MDDYISRQGAIEALRICELGEEMSIIEIMPSADVVKVVRCKDCINNPKNSWFGCPMAGKHNLREHDYCSYGARRTDG